MVTPDKPPLRVVGLTGGIGSGKSAAAGFFVARGIRNIDTDQISHRLTSREGAAIPEILRLFGAKALDNSGAMDRSAMRALVFADAAARAALEAILHPRIVAEADREIHRLRNDDEYPHAYALLAIPLLFERMTFRDQLWRTLVIDCAVGVQVERVAKRSQLSPEEVRRVVAAQIPRQVRLQLGDDVIWNGGDLVGLERSVEGLHQSYIRMATK